MDKTLLFRFAAKGQKVAAAAFGGLAGRAEKLQRQVLQANRAAGRVGGWADQARQFGATARAARRAAKETAALEKAQAKAERQAQRLANKQKALAQIKAAQAHRKAAMGGMGGLAGGIFGGLATGAAMGGVFGKAIGFESAMADVNKVMNFSSPDGLEKLGKDLMRLSAAKIPLKPEQLAAIAAAGGQLGVSEKAILPFVKTTSKMSVAWDMSAEAAGKASAKLSNIFDIPIDKVEALGDAVNHLSDNTAAEAPDMINVMTRVGAVGKQFGLSAVQTAALGNAFLALGRPPEIAATGINALLNKLQTADKQGAKFQAGLAAIGMDAMDLKDAMANDAQGALMSFLEAVKGLDESERAGVLMDMFGMEYADDLSILVGGLDKYRQALNLVGKESNYLGSMTKEFQNRSKTTANQLELLGNKLSRLAINAGTVLLPTLNAIVGAGGWVLDLLADFQESFPVVSGVVTGLALGTMGLVTAWKLGRMVGGFFVGGIKEMVAVVRLLRNAELMATAASKLHSLALVRQKAVSAAVAAKQWLVIAATKAWAVAQWLVNAALWANPLSWVVAGVVALAAGAYLLIRYWDQVAGFFGWLWGGIKEGASTAWAWIKSVALAPIDWIKSGWAGTKSFFGGLWDGIKAGAGQSWATIKQMIMGPINWLKGTSLYQAGAKLVGTFVSGVKAMVMRPVEVVKNMLAKIREYLPFSDAKRGPLSTLTLSGQSFVGTFASGMAQRAGSLAKTVAGMAQSAWQGLKGMASSAWDWLSSFGGPGLGKETSGLAKAQADLAMARGQAQSLAAPSLQLTLNQTINATGTDQTGLKTVLDQGNTDLVRLIERTVADIWARNQRTSMGNVGA